MITVYKARYLLCLSQKAVNPLLHAACQTPALTNSLYYLPLADLHHSIMGLLEIVGPYIPRQPGFLPKWLLFISIVSIFNSIQTYASGLALTRKVYAAKPGEVTNLSARTFGTWTIISSIIRFHGAYHLNNPQVYQIVFASYAVAFFHFNSEWLVYKTCRMGSGLLGPMIVATSTLIWMTLQRDFYLN